MLWNCRRYIRGVLLLFKAIHPTNSSSMYLLFQMAEIFDIKVVTPIWLVVQFWFLFPFFSIGRNNYFGQHGLISSLMGLFSLFCPKEIHFGRIFLDCPFHPPVSPIVNQSSVLLSPYKLPKSSPFLHCPFHPAESPFVNLSSVLLSPF